MVDQYNPEDIANEEDDAPETQLGEFAASELGEDEEEGEADANPV